MSKLFDSNKILSKLTERAEDIINHSKDNDTIGVISIFKNLCIPFNNENPKRMLFEKIFDMANINYTWDKNIGFIIFSEKKNKKTIVSHMDLIKLFNNGFKKERTHEIKDGYLSGALDNTLTNAILINSILNNRDKNTTYLFTLDEETKQHAIRDYMKKFGNEQFIINLDITNEGYDNNMTIEYDEPCYHICKQIDENLESPFFTTDRECDDLDGVMKANGFGFSYCIPTKGNIHSYKNYTNIDKISPYMDGLEFLIHELDLACYAPNIEYIDIKKAISYGNYNKFKKEDSKPIVQTIMSIYKEKSKKRIKNIKDKTNLEFSDEFNNFIDSSDIKKKRFKRYVKSKIIQDREFASTETLYLFPKINFEKMYDLNFLYLVPNGSKYLSKFNEEKVMSKINKEAFHDFILKMTASFEQGEILHMKKFLDKFSKKKDFSEDDFEGIVQGWLLYSLSGYEVFKNKGNGGYKINYAFMNSPEFKIWEFSNRFSNINSLNMFFNSFDKEGIIYSDIVACEKDGNIGRVDLFITQMMSAKLIKVNKKEPNSFKFIKK